MKVYQDAYERCGSIMEDLFMAVRLVVDTGMNEMMAPAEGESVDEKIFIGIGF